MTQTLYSSCAWTGDRNQLHVIHIAMSFMCRFAVSLKKSPLVLLVSSRTRLSEAKEQPPQRKESFCPNLFSGSRLGI